MLMSNEKLNSPGNNKPEWEVFGTSESARREIESVVRGYLVMSVEDSCDEETFDFRRTLSDFVSRGLDSGLRRFVVKKDSEGAYNGLIREETPTENARIAVYYLFMANKINFYKKPYIDELAKALGLTPFGEEGRWAIEDYITKHGLIPLDELAKKNIAHNN